jgi:hypothetical protein
MRERVGSTGAQGDWLSIFPAARHSEAGGLEDASSATGCCGVCRSSCIVHEVATLALSYLGYELDREAGLLESEDLCLLSLDV